MPILCRPFLLIQYLYCANLLKQPEVFTQYQGNLSKEIKEFVEEINDLLSLDIGYKARFDQDIMARLSRFLHFILMHAPMISLETVTDIHDRVFEKIERKFRHSSEILETVDRLNKIFYGQVKPKPNNEMVYRYSKVSQEETLAIMQHYEESRRIKDTPFWQQARKGPPSSDLTEAAAAAPLLRQKEFVSHLPLHAKETHCDTIRIMNDISFSSEHIGQRLDKALAELFPQFSRAYLQQALKQGKILIDQKIVPAKYLIKGHETLSSDLTESLRDETAHAENIPLEIIFEDEDILVINKPVGLVVHPGAGNWHGTLVNALLHHCPSLAMLPRAGIVHRLDKDTSGLLVVAKNRAAHHSLIQQLQARKMHREYFALVYGELTAGGKVEGDIGRDPRDRLKMALVDEGKEAITHYRLAERFKHFTLLRVNLETGRTHQIRVHLASIHHPLVGDPLYGKGLRLPKNASLLLIDTLKNFKHQALHAAKLSFEHPASHELVTFTAPLPEDFEALLKLMKTSLT